jgi:RNA polymerase sigma-70 factor (ECF subfamily)
VSDEKPADAELLAATVRGDGAAFGALVRRHVRAATLLAAQLVGDPDDAEDVVQDAFTVVYRGARSFDGSRPFGPWLFGIVRRLASNRLARDARRSRLLRVWGAHPDSTTAGARSDEAFGAISARLDAEVATRAMRELPTMQRACFELVVSRDLSIGEVAAMHGIAESTVRQHLFRARAALRAALGQEEAKRDEEGADRRATQDGRRRDMIEPDDV